MCLIIHSPVNHTVDYYTIKSALHYNPDGVGIMYFDHKRKRPMVDKMLKATADSVSTKLKSLHGTEYAIHFRMKTHGDVNYDNLHPYPVKGGSWLMHNGILSCGNKADPKKSDTWHYINHKLNKIRNPDWKFIEKDIGHNNKFTILTKDGEFILLNKKDWIPYEGALYSNTYAWDYPYDVWSGKDWCDYPANDDEYQPVVDAVIRGLARAIYNGRLRLEDSLDAYGLQTYDDLIEVLELATPDTLANMVTEFFDRRA